MSVYRTIGRLVFTSPDQSRYTLLSCQNVCDAVSYLLDIIFILDSEPSYTDNLLEFRWVQIALLSWLTYFSTATKKIPWILHDNQADVIEAISNGFVSSKIHDKRDDLDFDIVNVPFSSPCFLWCIHFAFIRFARVCNHVADFNARNKCLTAKLLQQGYRYHKH